MWIIGKINLSPRSFQTGNLSTDNFKKILDLDGSTLEPAVRSGQDRFWQLSTDHNVDVQLVFSWAPKLARECESKHWFPCGEDRRSFVRCTVAWLPNILGWIDFLSYGASLRHYSSIIESLIGEIRDNIINEYRMMSHWSARKHSDLKFLYCKCPGGNSLI